jgi:hypothetical protein
LVEQRIENPRVRGSNPRLGTTSPYGFSAAAYFFIRLAREELTMPVGRQAWPNYILPSPPQHCVIAAAYILLIELLRAHRQPCPGELDESTFGCTTRIGFGRLSNHPECHDR